jgi:hypothetical protein
MQEKGAAAAELAFILPILLVLIFGVIDIGRLIQARLILTNVSREGGSLASRGFASDSNFLNMLLASGTPLNLSGPLGKIYVSRIRACTFTPGNSLPSIDTQQSKSIGGLVEVPSSINSGNTLGLSTVLYEHLKYKESEKTSDISEVWVVEVYYKYNPITPLPNFITGIFGSRIIGSKSVF